MKTYKRKTSLIPLIFIISILFLIVLIKIFLPSNYFKLSFIQYVPFGFIICLVILYQWKNSISKISVKEKSIAIQSFLKIQEVSFDEIKGFEKIYWQISSRPLQYILIRTNNESSKNIRIYPSYKNFTELEKWIEANFTNLDVVKENAEWEQVLNNEDIGINRFDRLFLVKKAKKTANILNTTALILLPFLFFKSTHPYIIIPAIIIPLLSFCAIFYFKGIIRFDDFTGNFLKYKIDKEPDLKIQSTRIYTNVFLAVGLPTIILFSIFYRDYNIIDYNGLWKTALLISLPLFVLCLLSTKEFEYKKIKSYLSMFIVIFFLFGYTFYSILGTNCILDFSVPVKSKGVVAGKYSDIVSRQTTFKSYYYKLAVKSDKQEGLIKFKVSKEIYDELEVDSNYIFYIKKGLFNIKWILFD